MEGNNDYKKHNFEWFNNLRKNGVANQVQVNKMETYYKDLRETKEISEYNSKELNTWADVLNINNSPTLLDLEKSRNKIKELLSE